MQSSAVSACRTAGQVNTHTGSSEMAMRKSFPGMQHCANGTLGMIESQKQAASPFHPQPTANRQG